VDISALSANSVLPDIATPSVAAVAVEFPPHRHSQDEVISALADFAGPEFRRFAATSGVATRQLALPLSQYRARMRVIARYFARVVRRLAK
jgi:hypothetical protein